MRDKRPVDELTIEELERILAIKKREQREQKLKRMRRSGRIVEPAEVPAPPLSVPEVPAILQSLGGAAAADSGPAPAVREVTPRFEEEPSIYYPPKEGQRGRFWRSVVNQSLFLVEVLAIAGVVFLGYQMFTSINRLQAETASAQALADEQRRATLPTLAPTPQIQLSQVVLPGGHTFTSSGEVQFNYAEIPAALRPLVESQIIQPIASRPPPTRETALELSIPGLDINQTIVQGTDWEALKLGIGQLLNGVNPGDDEGNLVLSGHNDIYGEYFRHLDQLKPGDEFFVRTQTQIHTYRVTETRIVDPTDVFVLDSRGGSTATLISCYPYKVNNKRIVVYADRVT